MSTAPAPTVDHRPDGSREAPRTLLEPAPRTLSLLDQLGLWANLGVSLLGPVGAVFVLQPFGYPALSIVAALLATVVGTLLGSALLGLSAVPGAQTGAPAMVLYRGLLGTRMSYLPTVLNIVQCIGWGVFEIVVISAAASQLLPWHGAHTTYVVAAGLLTTAMALRPLGAVRVLRRYALAAVVVATVYLYVQLLRHPLPALTHGSWRGFWAAADVAVAVAVSWVPLAADYTRHARRPRSAFTGAFVGFAVTQIAYYALGLIALGTVVRATADPTRLQHDMFGAFIAVPVGWLAFGVLVLRELDQSFADTYSTVVSLQNLRPLADRRVLAVAIGALATLLALVVNIADYQSFLYLLGSVFVPMFAVLAVDYFLLRRGGVWDTTAAAPARPLMLLPWLLGFAAYQLVNPGGISWWAVWWQHAQRWLHFTPQSWMSASVVSFVVAAVMTAVVTGVRRRSAR